MAGLAGKVMRKGQKRLGRKESGAAIIEYAFLVSLIAIVVVVVVAAIGNNVESKFDSLRSEIARQQAQGSGGT